MKQITKEELKSVIDSHQLWLNDHNCGECADLSDTDLHNTDFSNINLSDANFRGSNLQNVNFDNAQLFDVSFRCADLSSANLFEAYLIDADLRYANLSYAWLHNACMIGADLTGAELRGANFSNANLDCADFSYATNLGEARLTNAELHCAEFSETDLTGVDLSSKALSMKCPSRGNFIGWKIAENHLVKLFIPEDAERSSGTTYRCRCSKAKVLGIFSLKGNKVSLPEVHSDFSYSFVYRVGEMVRASHFDENRWKECTTGIHFFKKKEQAIAYAKDFI